MNSKTLKTYCKQIDTNVRVHTLKATRGGRAYDWAYRIWNFKSPRDLRILALRVVYGDSFEINENAIAGNVRENDITLSPEEWQETIELYEEANKKTAKCPQCEEIKDSVCYRPNHYAQDVGNNPEAYWTACDECDRENTLDI